MLKSSCVRHPENSRFVRAADWQIEACGGDHCAALLLSHFEHWHNIVMEAAERARHHNDTAERHGDNRSQDESFVQYHTSAQLRERLLGFYEAGKISAGIEKLVGLGFLKVTKNPNPRYAFDKIRHFIFYPDAVNSWISAWKENRASSPEKRSRSEEKPEPSKEKPRSLIDAESDAEKNMNTRDANGNGHHRNGEPHPEIFSLGAVVPNSRTVPMAEVATRIVEHLNTATGSKFRAVAATLDPICARLREPGVDVAGVLKMIDRQVAKWRGTEMEQYLRPSTLFRASKFNEYYAAKDLPLQTNGARPKAMVERDAGILDGGIGGFED